MLLSSASDPARRQVFQCDHRAHSASPRHLGEVPSAAVSPRGRGISMGLRVVTSQSMQVNSITPHSDASSVCPRNDLITSYSYSRGYEASLHMQQYRSWISRDKTSSCRPHDILQPHLAACRVTLTSLNIIVLPPVINHSHRFEMTEV